MHKKKNHYMFTKEKANSLGKMHSHQLNSVFTSVPLKFIFGDDVSTGVKVFLQRVHLSAQNVPEGFHF